MIYASSSIVINSSAANLWQVISTFLEEASQGQYISECKVLENYYDGFTRAFDIAGEGVVKERVFTLKEQNKIVARLEDNPLLIGDTIYQIVAPDNAELSERRVTLCIVIAWRMRPGIIEAPLLNKQIIVDDLIDVIKELAESSSQ